MRVLAVCCLLLSTPAHAGIGDEEWTEFRQIERIQVAEGSSAGVIYLRSVTGSWGVPDCGTGVQYLRFDSTDHFADAALATVLMAKASGATIQARGICGPNTTSYLDVNYIKLE